MADFPKRLKAWLQKRGAKVRERMGRREPRALGVSLRDRIPKKVRDFDFDFRKVDLNNVSSYSGWIRGGLAVLGIFLLAALTAGIIGLWVRPVYTNAPKKQAAAPMAKAPTEDYDAILRRNMFNVEGKIPGPIGTEQLDCLSEAKPSTQRITLLGTIVMSDERHSVALIQDEGGSAGKLGVKKDEVFGDGKYVALKVERKKLCFQVKASQEFEYVEIPEEGGALGTGPSLGMGNLSEGITPVSENEYVVKQNFLEKNLLNLNEILQTARAVPYVEPGSGKFRGFLVQSIDPGSPFAQLGIRQGDILTGVNDIVLDNAGKGLEAFQRLRNSNKISLEVIRGGSKQTVSYDVK